MRVVSFRLAASITLGLLIAAAGASDDPISFVPWKVVIPGETPPASPFTLFWIPSSPDDFKHSDMLYSRPLTAFAAQCVAMDVIRADDNPMIGKLGVSGALPTAVLVDGGGKQLGKVDNEHGVLRVTAVERLVRDQLRARDLALDAQLEDAQRKAAAGDRDAAVAGYKAIWDFRCLAPKKAKIAQRELKKLGADQ